MFDFFKVFDIALAELCLVAAMIVTNLSGGLSRLTQMLGLRISLHNALILFSLGIILHYIFRQLDIYSPRRLSTLFSESWDLVKGISTIAILLLVLQLVYPMQIINMKTIQVFWLMCVVAFIASRLMLRLFLTAARKSGRNLRKILIVGSNVRAIKYANKFHNVQSFGYNVLGFVDNLWHGPAQNENGCCKLVADFSTFQEYLRHNVVDEIFIFLPLKSSYCAIEQVIEACEEQGVVALEWPLIFSTSASPRGG
jgi:FlaA1/EpsC-like NDP-sugar epimerase